MCQRCDTPRAQIDTGAVVLHFPVMLKTSKMSLLKLRLPKTVDPSLLWLPSSSHSLPQLTSALQCFCVYCRGISKCLQNLTQYSWLFQNTLLRSAKAAQNLLQKLKALSTDLVHSYQPNNLDHLQGKHTSSWRTFAIQENVILNWSQGSQ